MNILIVNDYGIHGAGTEVRLKLLIEKLGKDKVSKKIHLVSKTESTSSKFISHLASEKTAYIKTKEIIKKYKIDLVQVHNSFAFSTNAIKAAKELQKPVIFFAHDYWGFCGRRNLINHKNKVCSNFKFIKCSQCIGLLSVLHLKKIQKQLNKCDIAIAPNTFVKEIYEKNGILVGKWKIIKPWIDLKLFKPNKKIKRDKNTLLFVGALTYAKGAVHLAKSLKYLVQEIPNIKLKFIGWNQEKTDPNRKRIQKILKENKTLQNVEFCGLKYGEDLIKEFQKAAVYVCPPIWPEVFGHTWAQAMACGCRIVTTNKLSFTEDLKKQNSVVADTNPEDLAKKIIQTMSQKNIGSSKNRKFIAANFNLNKNIKTLIAVYELLLKYPGILF